MKRGLSPTKDAQAPYDRFDWDRLRIFRAVAQTGSMTAAASMLGGSLPTISRRVTDLETALQTELFRRNHSGVNLTEAGRTLLRHADLMADTIQAAQDEVSMTAADQRVCLQLVCCESLALYWVASRLADFQLSHPDLVVDLSISNSPADFHRLSGDIAIQLTRPADSDLVARRIGRSHHAAFVSVDWRAARPLPSSLSELARVGALVHAPYADQLSASGESFAGLNLMRRMSAMETMTAFCQSGVAPAVLPTHLADRFPNLVICPEPRAPACDIWLYHTPRIRRMKQGGRFLDWLQDIFSPGASNWFRQVDVTRRC